MEEDWEVVGADDVVEWVEVTALQSPAPFHHPSSDAAIAALEDQLRAAQARAARAEEHAQQLGSRLASAEQQELRAQRLAAQLAAAQQQVRSLEVVVAQQRAENENLRAAVLLTSAPAPPHDGPSRAARARKERAQRPSKALARTAPEKVALPKRKAWGKANHRTSTCGARHI